MKTIRYELADGIATLTFDEPGSPVNTMCAQWQADLVEATAQVVQDKDAIKGIVLASAKTTFFAGADLKGTMRLQASDAGRVFAEIEQTKKCFRTLETLGKPVVSCLNGAALGGGWEVALVGHYRVAIDNPKIQLGLPEITLGLIPGASGITKMTRLLGLMGAQPYILESKLFNPREAQALGLVHELVPDAAGLRPAALAWIAANPQAQQPWDDKNYKMPGGTPANPKIAGMLSVAPAVLKQKTRGLYPAPEYALAAMVDVLCCVLSGANWGPFAPPFALRQEIPKRSVGKGIGHFFGAMRIDGFIEPEEFKRQMDDWVRTFRATKPQPGTPGVIIPGDPERHAELERRKEGIPLLPAVIEELRDVSRLTGVPFA